MNLIRGLFLFLVLISWSEKTQGQILRPRAASSVSISYPTCYGASGHAGITLSLVNFTSAVVGGYTLVINKAGVYYTTLTSSTIQSTASITISVPGLLPGEYTFSGTVTAYNQVTSSTIGAYPVSNSFSLGYQAVWSELREMSVQSVQSMVRQNVITPSQSFAGARTLNNDVGDFWFNITPLFNSGNTGNRSIFVPLFYTSGLGTFNPSTFTHYIEFRRAGSDPATGDGIYYKSPTGTVKFEGVTYSNILKVYRNAGTITLYADGALLPLTYNNAGTSTFFSTTNNSTSALSVHTKILNDGVNVETSIKCNTPDEVYATLFDETDGAYYTMKNGKLRFVFNQNYDTQNNLKFNIYNFLGNLHKTQVNFPAVQATYGDNYITLDLTTTSGCLGSGMFVLEVISDKKEKTYLRFYNEYNSCTPEGETLPGGLGG